jgi:hypothetical protein
MKILKFFFEIEAEIEVCQWKFPPFAARLGLIVRAHLQRADQQPGCRKHARASGSETERTQPDH